MKKILNKSFITNFLSVVVIAIGYVSPIYQELIKSIGFFALSGAITNWLAIYMLFEKVPLLYGSGVIPNRFEEFKASIKNLMMEQFFTTKNIEQFIENEEKKGSKILNLEPLMNAVDYERIFDGLTDTIMMSSFGGMLQMMGGVSALQPLKAPFTDKMRSSLVALTESERFKTALSEGLDAHRIGTDIIDKIEIVIDTRLSELTPQLVKEMVQSIIREHLGWLVVWGGIFGAVMGAAFVYA